MKMKDYISDFTKHLKDAITIGESASLKLNVAKIDNVLICGLGGSGIGGTIVSDIISEKVTVPIFTNKDYSIPGFVSQNTLVIANSYSGNTEETLSALNKCFEKKAKIAIISSGGKLIDFAKKNNCNFINIPGGSPPRAMFGYAFTELFYILNSYGVIDDSFKSHFKNAIKLLDAEKKNIQIEAQKLAKKLHRTTPVIYVANGFEGVAIRFRQQINENSKMLCWHHVVPEMNHNELLGWRTNVEKLSVVYFRNLTDNKRNKIRIDINKNVISQYTQNINEVWSKGDSLIENSLYHIHLGDWTSWYLSVLNAVDAVEIDVINYLKNELGKL